MVFEAEQHSVSQCEATRSGDGYDNALAEWIIGLYKTELVRNRGPWRGLDDLELATLEWVAWFNHRRIFHESSV
jgi:transposase InsO family protein